MRKTIEVTYDGEVIKPTEPLDIPPSTKLCITFETENPQHYDSFVDAALANPVEGPPDWSATVGHHQYGGPAEVD